MNFRRETTEVCPALTKPNRKDLMSPKVLIRSSSEPSSYLGFVTDRSLLSYFHSHSQFSAALNRYLSNPLHSLSLPSLSLRSAVVYNTASETVLDAMKLMSEQGVSSVAIVEDNPTAQSMNLLSAVSVTDIGKVCVALWYLCCF